MERLEDESQLGVPESGQLLVVHAGGIDAIDLYAARGGQIQQAHDVEEGRFATTGGSHDADELALLDGQVYIFECLCLDLFGPIDLIYFCQFNDFHMDYFFI